MKNYNILFVKSDFGKKIHNLSFNFYYENKIIAKRAYFKGSSIYLIQKCIKIIIIINKYFKMSSRTLI